MPSNAHYRYSKASEAPLVRITVLLPTSTPERRIAAGAMLEKLELQFDGGSILASATLRPIIHGWWTYTEADLANRQRDAHVAVTLDKVVNAPWQAPTMLVDCLRSILLLFEQFYQGPLREREVYIMEAEVVSHVIRSVTQFPMSCATCGEPIQDSDHASVEWLEGPDGRRRSEVRVYHMGTETDQEDSRCAALRDRPERKYVRWSSEQNPLRGSAP